MFSKNLEQPIGLEWYTVIGALVIAPFLETFLWQSLPFSWSTNREKPLLLTISLMTIPFALLHAHRGIAAFLGALIGGVTLSAIYIVWSNASKSTAFAATALTHFLHNAGTLSLMLNSGVTMIPIAQS
ncbi:CPBP family intramembrane glutamic endopeptidase [Undibacterium danionis]|uniref:CPBP family intramembrane glutamic endopeptidase n=1 Tax=Undibacterium danionis TaxID=1812100 RepID=A0ABV6I8P1_9BURK